MAKSKEQKDKEHAEAVKKAEADEAAEIKAKADAEKAEKDAKAKAKADSEAAEKTEKWRADDAREIARKAALAVENSTAPMAPPAKPTERTPQSEDMDDFLELLLAAGLDFQPKRKLNKGEILACEEWANKTIDEYEVAEMIDCEVLLDAVDDLALPAWRKKPGIADEDIERCIDGANVIGAGNDGVKVSQIELQRRRQAFDTRTSRLRSLQRAARTRYPGTAFRQHSHRFETDSRRAPRHHSELAAQIDACGNLFRRRVRIEIAARYARCRCLLRTRTCDQ